MRREYHFWVYILGSRSRNLYVGVTNNITGRLATHRDGKPGSFTARYQVYRLVYFEYCQYVRNALARETELKGWTRAEKIDLIERMNPTWEDVLPPEPVVRTMQTADSLTGMTTRKAKATATADSLRE